MPEFSLIVFKTLYSVFNSIILFFDGLFQLPISGYIYVDKNSGVNAALTPTNDDK